MTFEERITDEINKATEIYLEQVNHGGTPRTLERCIAALLVARVCELEKEIAELKKQPSEG